MIVPKPSLHDVPLSNYCINGDFLSLSQEIDLVPMTRAAEYLRDLWGGVFTGDNSSGD